MLRPSIDRLYLWVRPVDKGLSRELPTGRLVGMLFDRGRWFVRAGVRRFPGAFIAPGVKLRGRKNITIGKSVVLGQSVLLDGTGGHGIRLGDRSTVDSYAQLKVSGVYRNLGLGITIGERTSIGAFNVILGQGGVTIGRDCLLGPQVTVVSENHDAGSERLPIRLQGETRSPVRIGDDVWIGAGAVILAGAEIGDGAIVAAGAVVRGRVASGSVVGGVPARTIGKR